MKRIILASVIAASSFAAQAQIAPAPSPLAKVYQVVGLTEVEIEYSRPALNNRNLFADFVPQNEIWRTGANMATKVTFSSEVHIGDGRLPAGTYAIFTVPSKGQIQVMFNSNADQGGTSNYDKALDVARYMAPLVESKEVVERMRFSIEALSNEQGELLWSWGTYSFTVPFKVETGAFADKKIAEKLKEIEGQYSFYNEAARYYLDSGNDAKKALEWAQKSVDMSAKFWNVHTLARAYHANGDKKNALKFAEESKVLSQKANYPEYEQRNVALIAEINKK